MQWHQLDHMQTICTSLQTDNHTNSPTPHHSSFTGWMLFLTPSHLQRLLFEWPSQHGAAWVPLLHPVNGLFSRTTWISQCQQGKTSLDFNEARDDGILGCSDISWTICKQSAHLSRQITTPTVQHPSLKFYRLNALPDAQPTVSKHWRHWVQTLVEENFWKWLWLPWMHVVEFSSSCGRGISWIN